MFKSLGLDLSTATGIFYRQALRYHGLPFEVQLDEEPNECTYAAMQAAEDVSDTGSSSGRTLPLWWTSMEQVQYEDGSIEEGIYESQIIGA